MRKKSLIGLRPGSNGKGSRKDVANYDKIVKNNDNEWVVYAFNDTVKTALSMKNPAELKVIRESYENFVYGYLYHYDMVIRNGADPHVICFVWDENHSGIRLFIDPKPMVASTPYPTIQKVRGTFLPQDAYKNPEDENGQKEKDWISPYGGSIDPTPPPPPPPPDDLS